MGGAGHECETEAINPPVTMIPMAHLFANWLPRRVVMYIWTAGASVPVQSGPAMAHTRSKIFRLV